MVNVNPSEIALEHLYLSRREFLVRVGALAASTVLLGACGEQSPPAREKTIDACDSAQLGATTDELGDKLTPCESIHSYNNFYEFTTSKEGVARRAQDFKTLPWKVEIGGLISKPQTFDIGDLLQRYNQEERIYRLWCVEAWSMVIPWIGFHLSQLLKEVEPTSAAKYLRFETLNDLEQMPGQRDGLFDWPYIEGLRLDEAINDLTILATGIYGKPLLPQDGAPIRLVVPWKYGFKSIKSIIRIDLVEEIPVSFWMASSLSEYGFYANVNPAVSHPRWS